ncbi:tyrosine-type recombinase/integrase [Roseinatronobacter bogoriensis]|nr:MULTISPECIES: tyrosine-type recombinase/integrase [Rhodobaca]MBB4209430.1 integrase [Rhodobaca bogoriensis DSM 18756]TDW35205.1 integrase [Rhodobaca barguzinensis]TDY66785.1 integrase [Rhodobaca bogoriensis DSM 18756]
MTVAAVLDYYGAEHAPHVADPARIGHTIDALLAFWADLPVSTITGETCRRYARSRFKKSTGGADPVPVAVGTVRRELATLQAALNHCAREGYLLGAPKVTLPPKPGPRERWLTRKEVARLLRAAWRNPRAHHLARFILISIYTGTRKSAVLNLRWSAHVSGGWIDLEHEIMHRAAEGTRRTKKRQPPAKLPRRLQAHLKRWVRDDARFVVTDGGQGVGSIRTAWATACAAAGLEGITPHVLRHTAITWAMQRGANKWDAASFFGVSLDTLERVYGHHHEDHQKSAIAAMDRRR